MARYFVQLRYSLIQLLYDTMFKNLVNGLPIARAMVRLHSALNTSADAKLHSWLLIPRTLHCLVKALTSSTTSTCLATKFLCALSWTRASQAEMSTCRTQIGGFHPIFGSILMVTVLIHSSMLRHSVTLSKVVQLSHTVVLYLMLSTTRIKFPSLCLYMSEEVSRMSQFNMISCLTDIARLYNSTAWCETVYQRERS